MRAFHSLVPNQTSEQEVEKLLGKRDGDEEAFLTEWTWLYLGPQNSDTQLGITLNTTSRPFLVSKVTFYNPGIDVASLIDQFGLPTIAYRVFIAGNEAAASSQTALAYPEQGTYAFVDSAMPKSGDLVVKLYKEPPQSEQSYLDELSKRTDIQIIQWP
jgi:hypothetical protein